MRTVFDSTAGFPIRLVPLPQFSDALLREVESFGVRSTKIQGSIISGRADWSAVYRCMYCCRLAMRILLPVSETRIQDRKDLYSLASAVPWESLFQEGMTLAVDVQGYHRAFTRTSFAALVVKDAIADRCRNKTGHRPSVDTEHPDVRIHLFIDDDYPAVLSLDVAGGSLHRRGLRHPDSPAPLNEVLAASILDHANYSPARPLYDPFCGYGTFVVEALMRLLAIPAGYFRFKDYQPWLAFQSRESWLAVKAEVHAAMEMRLRAAGKLKSPLMYAADIDQDAVVGTQAVMEKIRSEFALEQLPVCVQQQDALEPDLPLEIREGAGLLVTNPPYGQRISTEDISALYREFSLVAKKYLPRWRMYVLSGNRAADKAFALRTFERMRVYNGQIECNLLAADILPV